MSMAEDICRDGPISSKPGSLDFNFTLQKPSKGSLLLLSTQLFCADKSTKKHGKTP
jgi:hypothetical protein